MTPTSSTFQQILEAAQNTTQTNTTNPVVPPGTEGSPPGDPAVREATQGGSPIPTGSQQSDSTTQVGSGASSPVAQGASAAAQAPQANESLPTAQPVAPNLDAAAGTIRRTPVRDKTKGFGFNQSFPIATGKFNQNTVGPRVRKFLTSGGVIQWKNYYKVINSDVETGEIVTVSKNNPTSLEETVKIPFADTHPVSEGLPIRPRGDMTQASSDADLTNVILSAPSAVTTAPPQTGAVAPITVNGWRLTSEIGQWKRGNVDITKILIPTRTQLDFSFVLDKIARAMVTLSAAKHLLGVTLLGETHPYDSVFEFRQLPTDVNLQNEQINLVVPQANNWVLVGNGKKSKIIALKFATMVKPVVGIFQDKFLNHEHSYANVVPTKIVVWTDDAKACKNIYSDIPDNYFCSIESMIVVMKSFARMYGYSQFEDVIRDHCQVICSEWILESVTPKCVSHIPFSIPEGFGLMTRKNVDDLYFLNVYDHFEPRQFNTYVHGAVNLVSAVYDCWHTTFTSQTLESNSSIPQYVQSQHESIISSYRSTETTTKFTLSVRGALGYTKNLYFVAMYKGSYPSLLDNGITLWHEPSANLWTIDVKFPTVVNTLIGFDGVAMENSMSLVMNGLVPVEAKLLDGIKTFSDPWVKQWFDTFCSTSIKNSSSFLTSENRPIYFQNTKPSELYNTDNISGNVNEKFNILVSWTSIEYAVEVPPKRALVSGTKAGKDTSETFNILLDEQTPTEIKVEEGNGPRDPDNNESYGHPDGSDPRSRPLANNEGFDERLNNFKPLGLGIIGKQKLQYVVVTDWIINCLTSLPEGDKSMMFIQTGYMQCAYDTLDSILDKELSLGKMSELRCKDLKLQVLNYRKSSYELDLYTITDLLFEWKIPNLITSVHFSKNKFKLIEPLTSKVPRHLLLWDVEENHITCLSEFGYKLLCQHIFKLFHIENSIDKINYWYKVLCYVDRKTTNSENVLNVMFFASKSIEKQERHLF